ncbi:MAG: hypothetical protein ACPGVU_21660, partial [Limisphaerales bacterium]
SATDSATVKAMGGAMHVEHEGFVTVDNCTFDGNVAVNDGFGYDLSTSYFLCLNADETIPAGVLAGDANLNWNPIRTPDFEKENPVAAGVQVLETTNHFNDLRWAIGRDHPRYYQRHDNDGNLAFTDGSVMHANTAQLRQVFQASTNAHKTTSHWLVVPQ